MALGIWLAVSVGVWLVGIAVTGKVYLPFPNGFTLFVIYGPWLVMLTIIVSAWGRRNNVRAAEPAVLSLAVLIAMAVALYPHRDTAKETYFKTVLSSCQHRHGIENISWENVPAFDGYVRRFHATTEADQQLVACVNRKAGFLINDTICPGEPVWPGATSALEVSFGNFHGIPPDRFFHIVHYEFAGATKRPSATREQCP